MAIRWFTDADREEMARAREDVAVYRELVARYTVYREATREPLSEGLLRILSGEVEIDPRAPTRDGERGRGVISIRGALTMAPADGSVSERVPVPATAGRRPLLLTSAAPDVDLRSSPVRSRRRQLDIEWSPVVVTDEPAPRQTTTRRQGDVEMRRAVVTTPG